jgi:hypothetical protein
MNLKRLKPFLPVRPSWGEAAAAASCGTLVFMGMYWHNDIILAGGIAFGLIDLANILHEEKLKRELSGK